MGTCLTPGRQLAHRFCMSPMTQSQELDLASALRRLKDGEGGLQAACMHAHVSQQLFGTRKEVEVAGTRFSLRRRLGAGAMGVVYEVERSGGSGSLALKLLHRNDGDEAYRLKREFRTLSRLGHPNLVILHELFVDVGGSAFTMELVDGVEFLDYVRNEGRPDLQRLTHVLSQLAEGLWYLHAEGVIHRDLKPSNVLVTRQRRAVLLDFGVALAGREYDVSGTARFMAPEQCLGNTVPESDLFALGVMLELALSERGRTSLLDGRTRRQLELLHELALQLQSPDPSARPTPRALLRALGSTATSAVPVVQSAHTCFVGRDGELAQLAGMVAEPRREPSLIYVEAEAGQGKSALLAELRRRLADAPGFPWMLVGRCCRRETVRHRALDPLIDALSEAFMRGERSLSPDLTGCVDAPLLSLFPVLSRVPAFRAAASAGPQLADLRERRAAAVASLRRLLHRLSQQHPLVMCVDDVHWLDDESLALMRELLQGSDAPPVLWICAGRPQQDGGFAALARLVPTRSTHRLTLAPLSEAETRTLARALWPEHETLWERAAALSAGNPLLLSQLSPLALMNQHTEELALERVVERRVRSLPALGRALLSVVALASEPLSLEQLGEAARVSRAELECALNLLEAQRYVRPTTTAPLCIQPYHDRIAEWIHEGMSHPLRTQVHRQIAETLARDAGTERARQLLFHYREAGEARQALKYGRLAAEHASTKLSFHEAASLFAECHALSEDAAEREAFAAARADALINAGRDRDAAELLRELSLSSKDDAARFERACRGAELFFQAGYSTDAVQLLTPWLADLDLMPCRTRVGSLASLAYHRLRARVGARGDLLLRAHASMRARQRVELCLLMARGFALTQALQSFDYASRLALHVRRGATESQRVQALLLAAILHANLAPVSGRAEALLEEARARSVSIDDPVLRARLAMATSHCAGFRIDRPTARAYAEEAVRLFESHGRGVQMELAQARWVALLGKFAAGAQGVASEYQALVHDALQRGDRVTEANARLCLANARLAGGSPTAARAEIEAAQSLIGPARREVVRFVGASMHARVDLYEGAPARAHARLTKALRAMALHGLILVPWLRIELRYLRALAALQARGAGATRQVQRTAVQLANERYRWPRLLADQLQAALLAIQGRHRDAARALHVNRAALESEGAAWYASGSCWVALELEERGVALEELRATLEQRGTPDPRRFLACYGPFLRSADERS